MEKGLVKIENNNFNENKHEVINIKKEIEDFYEDTYDLYPIHENKTINQNIPVNQVLRRSNSLMNVNSKNLSSKSPIYEIRECDAYNNSLCFICKTMFSINRFTSIYRAYDNNICKNCFIKEISKIN